MSKDNRPDIIRHTISSTGKEFIRDVDVRGNQINLESDPKIYSLGINDIDNSILTHIREKCIPLLTSYSTLKLPTVTYATPEIAPSLHKTDIVRDVAGKIVYPCIVIERASISKSPGLSTKMDSNYSQNYYTYVNGYDRKNIYDKFSVLNNRTPVKEIKTVPIPDYILVTYNCYVFTDYVEHHNHVIEAIRYTTNSYWGEQPNSYLTVVGDIPTEVEYSTENGGRVALSQFQLTTYGFLLPDTILRQANSSYKKYSKAVVNINIDIDE